MTRHVMMRLCAAGIALSAFGLTLWQNVAAEFGAPAPAGASVPGRAQISAPAPTLPVDPAAPTLAGLPALPAAFFDDSTVSAAINAPEQVSRYGLPCGLDVAADATPPAMIALVVTAPCRPNTRILVSHAGLTVTVETDLMGTARAVLPGLTDPARIDLVLPNGDAWTVTAPVADLADYDRILLVWDGPGEMQLHAREWGADYGSDGHIWAGNPGTPARAINGHGGFVTELGGGADAPIRAQVYTFPRDTLMGTGSVRLSVEVPVGQANCGRLATAELMQTDHAAPVTHTDIEFHVPGCTAIGEFMVLQNLIRDLRIAAN